jgi:hypothetical protein
MTDAPKQLEPFEDCPVIGSAIEIPSAGGGLRDALKLDPVELRHGDTVYVVLACVVQKVRFDPAKKADDNELTRVHVLGTSNATIVDRDLVIKHLDAQQERIRLAREIAEGIARLPYDDGTYANPEDAHAAGEHASGLHPDCGECNAEAAAAEFEAENRAVLDLPKGPLAAVPDLPAASK